MIPRIIAEPTIVISSRVPTSHYIRSALQIHRFDLWGFIQVEHASRSSNQPQKNCFLGTRKRKSTNFNFEFLIWSLISIFCISPSRATWSRLLYRRLLLMSHKVKWLRPLSPHCVKRDPNVSINDLKIPINVRQYHWRMHLLPLLPLIGGPLILSGC